jgi:hypothetical protein
MIIYMQFSRRLLLILFVRKTDPFMLNTTILLKYAIYVSNLRTIIGVLLKKLRARFHPVAWYNYSS